MLVIVRLVLMPRMIVRVLLRSAFMPVLVAMRVIVRMAMFQITMLMLVIVSVSVFVFMFHTCPA